MSHRRRGIPTPLTIDAAVGRIDPHEPAATFGDGHRNTRVSVEPLHGRAVEFEAGKSP
jgi:hypothetical protein